MQLNEKFRTLGATLRAAAVYLTIFIVGLQYSFYQVFSSFRVYDDEGSMMLRVRAFIENPAAFDSLGGYYGPFYYLHKYAIYYALNSEVTHDINRLTTIVLWGIIAATCAVFVQRVSRSIILAAIVQMQVILHLTPFINEPGHPHEIALVLIAGALVASSFVGSRRGTLFSILGLGVATGALLLVKINLGTYLGVSVALCLLGFLPGGPLAASLRWLGAAVAVLLPAAIMWRHMLTPSMAQNYGIVVTALIAASLIASWRRDDSEQLQSSQILSAGGAAALTIAGICAVMIGWGSSLAAIANTVVLRALSLPAIFSWPPEITQTVAISSMGSLLLAIGYRFMADRIVGQEAPTLFLSVVKLAYGCFTLYVAYDNPDQLLLLAIPFPFIWLVVIEPYRKGKPDFGERFPRVFLCLLAAFQTLQAYPAAGSQLRWSVFLIIPLAALCIGDALRAICAAGKRHWRQEPDWLRAKWFAPVLTLLFLVGFSSLYYQKAAIAHLQTSYAQQDALNLPGASRIRLPEATSLQFRWLADNISSGCDGFVGLPGFASLYFWTQIPAPGVIAGAWAVNLEDDRQREIVEKMETYQRPCVLYNHGNAMFWTQGKPLDAEKPLLKYIETHYRPVKGYGAYALLTKVDATLPATQPSPPAN